MIADVIMKVFGTTKLTFEGYEIDFSEEWGIVSFKELLQQDIGLDVDSYGSSQELLTAIQAKIFSSNTKIYTL